MSDKVYAGVGGIVQFDPRVREANGKSVTSVTVKALGTQKLIDITIWPEFELTAPVKKGDFVVADGEFTQRSYQAQDGSTREGLQVSASSLVVVPGILKASVGVTQAPAVTAAPVQVVQAAPGGDTSPKPIPF